MQSISSKINSSSSRRMGKLTGVLPCFNGTREVKEIKENHTNKTPEKNASLRRFRTPVELRILDSATRWEHLKPLTNELIRRLFPNSQFIVVNQARKYGQLQAMKLLNLFRTNRLDELTITPCEPKQCNVKNLSCASSRRCRKTFRIQPNELNQNTSTDEATILPRSCCLVLKAEEIQDKDLRDMFFLELLPADQSKFVIGCFASPTSPYRGAFVFVSFHSYEFSDHDCFLLKSFENQLLETVTRIHSISAAPGTKYDEPDQESSNLLIGANNKLKLSETSHFVCKTLARIFGCNLMFLLFQLDNSVGFICPATSETAFSQEKIVNVGNTIFDLALTTNQVYVLSDRDQLDRLRDTILESQTLEATPWNLLSCFSVDLLTELSKTEENGHFAEVNSLYQEQSHVPEKGFMLLLCIPNHRLSEIRSIESSGSLIGPNQAEEETKEQLTTELKRLSSVLYEAYLLRLESRIPSVGQQLNSNFPASSVINQSSDAIIRKMMDRIQYMLSYDNCSLYIFDKKEKTWIAEILNYPTDDQTEKKRRWRNYPGILNDCPLSQLMGQASLDERIQYCNKTYSNVFWIPLRLEDSHINALVQFNKRTEFTQAQKKLLREDIAQYCLTGVSQFLLLREKEVSQYRLDVLEELLSYHMKAFEGDVEALCLRESRPFDEKCPPDFQRFTFVPRSLNHVDSVQATIFMFFQLHFVQRWQIPIPVLTRFILTVQRNYRNPPYHNWTHAFCVGHFAFLCLTNASQRLQSYLDPLELFALFVGALCHDIDHRGYNNAYQRLSGSALASLYGANGSILENHHVDHTVRILRIKECDIFVNLTTTDDQRVMRLLRQIILATDLENHIQLVPKIRAMASRGGYDPTNVDHHFQLLSILVTASDLSDQCKPWVNTRVAASLIYKEFFHQGDCKKSFDMQPPHSMDRSKAFIPDLQISFLDSIVMPCFQILSDLIPECALTMETIKNNRQVWMTLSNAVKSNRISNYTTDRLFAGQFDHFVDYTSAPRS